MRNVAVAHPTVVWQPTLLDVKYALCKALPHVRLLEADGRRNGLEAKADVQMKVQPMGKLSGTVPAGG